MRYSSGPSFTGGKVSIAILGWLCGGKPAGLLDPANREGTGKGSLRALLSVANRDGLTDLARALLALEVEVYATDGTREALAADEVSARPISDLTSQGSLAGGQVKTFHPAVYGGILARRHRPDELEQLAQAGIGLIDIVVVNVMPFAPEVRSRTVPLDEAIEMIDIGGNALLSAAARNYAAVAAVSNPRHYSRLTEELKTRGIVLAEFRQRLVVYALADVAAYYAEVAGYLNHIAGTRFPDRLALVLEKKRDMAYGENPHQEAAFYRETTHRTGSLADATVLQGNPPTFNDIIDLDAAYRMATDFTSPTCCIVKQANRPAWP